MSKERLDVLLVNRGLAESREAKAIIMSEMCMLRDRRRTRLVQHL